MDSLSEKLGEGLHASGKDATESCVILGPYKNRVLRVPLKRILVGFYTGYCKGLGFNN